jgi:GNAT superfamily N-acetyltransferase
MFGTLCALRNYPGPGHWYLGLLLLAPAWRGQGLGRRVYLAFEAWVAGQGADSDLLSVVEANTRAASFWESLGFALPRCYQNVPIGNKHHVLIEYEKPVIR